MAERFDYFLDHQQIYGRNYRGLEPNWDFQDEFTAMNPITNMEAFPRCSTPIPKELKPRLLRTLPISILSFDEQCYEEFKIGLRQLPDSLSVHGIKCPPQFVINGHLVPYQSIKKLKEPTFENFMHNNYHQLGVNIETKHPKCQKQHLFNNNQQLSSKLKTSEPYLVPWDESEFNTMVPNVPEIPIQEGNSNDLDIINDKDQFNGEVFKTMPYADSKKSDETESLTTNKWASERNVLKSAQISTSDESDTELPSTCDDFDLSELLCRLRTVLKDD